MTIRALLFDVDGTLADTEEAHRLAFNEAFLEAGLGFVWSPDEYERLLLVGGGKERLEAFFEGLGIEATERARLVALIPTLHRRKNMHYTSIVARGGTPLRPGIARLIGEAELAGVRVAIASTTSPENVTALLDAQLGHGSRARFAAVACGDVVAAKKPAPDIYRFALAELDVAAADAVAFEDSEIGLKAAKDAGLFTVVTPTRWTQAGDFSTADLLVPHLGDVVHPLDGEVARQAGGALVTLELLREMHERPRQRLTAGTSE